MKIYGVALLALCYIAGKTIGITLGNLIGIQIDLGGVGFAIFILVYSHSFLQKKGLIERETESGIIFWSSMYIPIIVAMTTVLNVKAALSAGIVAVLAGGLATMVGFILVPVISKINNSKR